MQLRTGISLHASNKVPNKRRRVHITVELPWAADKATSTLTVASLEPAQGPLYVMVSTDIGGERRRICGRKTFTKSWCTHARGDRRAATGVDLSDGNVDSKLGIRSLQIMLWTRLTKGSKERNSRLMTVFHKAFGNTPG